MWRSTSALVWKTHRQNPDIGASQKKTFEYLLTKARKHLTDSRGTEYSNVYEAANADSVLLVKTPVVVCKPARGISRSAKLQDGCPLDRRVVGKTNALFPAFPGVFLDCILQLNKIDMHVNNTLDANSRSRPEELCNR